ncbi:hypothetical protein DOTSEDRAFT_71420 [Dothistroma septosporum NZE10]|uniref:Catalase core domain-containing protein n=1 Tax=Dothistroma septosporum (strain NZE10 / CBS 128990) TaxID=675120 RepID=N1PRZ2_DOTSN|nr:hypothetical protein DOTSEDRAFT_71420 [Dothistroma septosporum NZE10]
MLHQQRGQPVPRPLTLEDDWRHSTFQRCPPFPEAIALQSLQQPRASGAPLSSGAFGYFEPTADVSGLTKADCLQKPLAKTPVSIRFSTVTLGRELPDEARNPRGFAVKSYTREGDYDIVGLNFPVFFCRDPIQGPGVIRSQARNPASFLLDHDATFDLLGNTPEGNHAGLMYFSDLGTPDGWTNLHGYGCHNSFGFSVSQFLLRSYALIKSVNFQDTVDGQQENLCFRADQTRARPDHTRRDSSPDQ